MATIAQVWSQHELIGNLVGREIRSRYKQSVLGMAWSVVVPLFNTLLYTFVFASIAKLPAGKNAAGHGIPYTLLVYIGQMFWGLFAAGVASGADSMTSNLQLLTKVYFPREVFTLSAIAARFTDFGFSFIVLVVLAAYFAVSQHFFVSWLVVLVPVILLIQLTLVLGLSFLLATVNLFYRDVRYVLGMVLQIWMFLTPVNYSLALFADRLDKHPAIGWICFHVNPMTSLMGAYQDLFLVGKMPDWGGVALAAVISVASLLVGYRVFAKYEGEFAEAI